MLMLPGDGEGDGAEVASQGFVDECSSPNRQPRFGLHSTAPLFSSAKRTLSFVHLPWSSSTRIHLPWGCTKSSLLDGSRLCSDELRWPPSLCHYLHRRQTKSSTLDGSRPLRATFHTRDCGPVTKSLHALSLVEKAEPVQVHYARGTTNGVSECKMDVTSTWIPTWYQMDHNHLDYFSKPFFRGRSNITLGDHGTLKSNNHLFITFYHL